MTSHLELRSFKDECLPLKVLDDLLSFSPSEEDRHKVEPLSARTHLEDAPKTLVCHDMKGGYLDDRYLNGTSNDVNYYFLHWSMVDIFVYFSHHFVTIPPCTWISAAHKNGVKILGTVITEWDAGAAICYSILSDVESVHQCCKQLVKVAEFYQFDGWLVNIENKLDATQVPLMVEFVRFLTQEMHNFQEDSVVIWYDSVIDTGELKWQNALNQQNREFFEACDGIFLNYNWTKDTLRSSAEAAGPRRLDVYVGADVFGRGCPGGGGFSTNIAVTEARNFNLSVAIFAPGWVFETLNVSEFKTNQYKFWDALIELCAPRITAQLPYYSSFCPGLGQKLFRNAKVEHSQSWFNFSLQQPQPSFHYTNCPTNGASITSYPDDAFNGGGCLKLSSDVEQSSCLFELNSYLPGSLILSSNFPINNRCEISYTFKPLHPGLKVSLVLGISDGLKFYQAELSGNHGAPNDGRFSCLCSKCLSSTDFTVSLSSSETINDSMDGFSWVKRKYNVYCHYNKECCIKKIQVHVRPEDPAEVVAVSVLLGELSVFPFSDSSTFSFRDLIVSCKEGDTSRFEFQCFLEWKLNASIEFSDLYLFVGDLKHFLCTTSQNSYKFRGCVGSVSEVEFFLVPYHFGKALHPLFLNVCLNQ